MTLFVGYLIQNNKQSSTVKSYISVLKAVLKMHNIPIDVNQCLLTSLTKACRLKNDSLKARLPIRRGVLRILLETTQTYYMNAGQPFLSHLYRALFSTMYFGLLRISEVTAGAHPVLVRDVSSIGYRHSRLSSFGTNNFFEKMK